MSHIELEDLTVLVKFCVNRITDELFVKMMQKQYVGESYILSKLPEFRRDPMAFIVGRGESGLLREIYSEIEKTGYKG